jgi:cell division septation protein DedD
MDSALKQRLIGAAVLVALAMIFLPMLLRSPDPARQDAAQVPLDAPAAPDQEFETREVPLALPSPGAADGVPVTGAADPASAGAADSAVVTVDPDEAAPRVDFDPDAAADAPVSAIDPATGEAVADDTMTAADAAADAPPPAAPLPVATGAGRYAVNVGSYSNLDNARALVAKLKAQDLPVTTEDVQVAGKAAQRVRVGPYGERTLAEAARLRVEGVTGGSASVIVLDGATAAPPPATRAPAAAEVGFAVQLGALSTEADANVLVDRAKAAGFVAFHQRVQTERGAVWRVRVGPEADRAAAQRLRDDVAAKLGLADAIVVSHP